MARIVPPSLLVCGQWNQASPALDEDILVINDCRYGSDASDRLYWPYTRNGQDVQGDDQGTVANMTATGTKWGMAQMVDLSNVGNNRWVTRDFGGSFARPTDLRKMSFAMWVQPTYSGTPATNVAFGGPGGQGWSGGTYNAGSLYHASADGKLKYIQYGSTHGVALGTTESSSAWNPTCTPPCEAARMARRKKAMPQAQRAVAGVI